jgi:thiamine biosynthesis lipoprotein
MPAGRAPTDSAIAAGLKVGGSIENIDIAGNRLSASVAEYTLDLGGIAKGAAVDRVVARLEALGIAPALVNAGGDLRVLGKPEGRQWRIGIKAPRADGLLGSVTLSAGEAAFSSGDYERYFEQDGVRLHHILDPRTGRPAIHTQAVTVVAQDGTMADAAATALFVAGPDEWRAMAERLGIELALRVDADGTVSMTPQMRDRFQTAAGDRSDIIAASD